MSSRFLSIRAEHLAGRVLGELHRQRDQRQPQVVVGLHLAATDPIDRRLTRSDGRRDLGLGQRGRAKRFDGG